MADLLTRPLAQVWATPGPLPSSAEALRGEVRDFLRARQQAGDLSPRCDAWLGGWDKAFSRELGRRGWLGMTVPREHGGHGRSALERFVVVEELLAAGAPVAAHWVADRQTAPALVRFGTAAQRRRYLPTIVRGECSAAIGMSEPDAGSDLAALRCRARPVDGGWRIDGTKLWTSGAHDCDLVVVLVRTGDPGGDRHQGLSQLLVDLPAEGLTIRPVRLLTGEHHFNELHFDGVFVPDAQVLGQVGEGWRQVLAELADERSGPERFLSTFPLLVALLRQLGPAPDRRAAAAVGALVAQLRAIRQLSVGVAGALARGEVPDVAAAVVKDLGTRFEKELVEVVRSVAAVEPDLDGPPLQALLAQALLHSPGYTLRGGTNEILRSIVAREIVR